MNNEKLAAQALDKKLDAIVEPLAMKIHELYSDFSCSGVSYETVKTTVGELLAVAILEGIKLAELVDERLDTQLMEQVAKQEQNEFASTIMCPDDKAKDVSIALNMNDKSGNFKRFVTPEELSQEGKLKK